LTQQSVPWSQQLNNLEGQMNNSDLVAAQATSSQKLKRQLRAQPSFKNAPENSPRRERLTSAALLRFAPSLLLHSFSPVSGGGAAAEGSTSLGTGALQNNYALRA